MHYSKSNLHEQISERGKSNEHQGGHCNPRGRALISTERLSANVVRSRQRRKQGGKPAVDHW